MVPDVERLGFNLIDSRTFVTDFKFRCLLEFQTTSGFEKSLLEIIQQYSNLKIGLVFDIYIYYFPNKVNENF